MLKKLLFFLFLVFLSTLFSYGKDNKRLLLIKQNYEQGAYLNSLSLIDKFLKKKNIDSASYYEAYQIQSKCYYKTFNFDKFINNVKQLEGQFILNNIDPQSNYKLFLLLDIYNEFNLYQQSQNLCDKFVNFDNLNLYNANQLKILYSFASKTGNLHYVNKINSYIDGKAIFNTQQNFQITLANLEIATNTSQLKNVDSLILTLPQTISHIELLKINALVGKYYYNKEYYEEAKKYLLKSYNATILSDDHPMKVEWLYLLTCIAIEQQQQTDIDKYFRRLQLHADRNLNSVSTYNHYYHLALAYKALYTLHNENAKKIYLSAEKLFKNIPIDHDFKIDWWELEKKFEVDLYDETIDSVLNLKYNDVHPILISFQLKDKKFPSNKKDVVLSEIETLLNRKSFFINKGVNDFEYAIALIENNLGKLYQRIGSYQKSLTAYKNAYIYFDKHTHKQGFERNYLRTLICEAYILENDIKNSKLLFDSLSSIEDKNYSLKEQFLIAHSKSIIANYFGNYFLANSYAALSYELNIKYHYNYLEKYIPIKINYAINLIKNGSVYLAASILDPLENLFVANNYIDINTTVLFYHASVLLNLEKGNFKKAYNYLQTYESLIDSKVENFTREKLDFNLIKAVYYEYIGSSQKAISILEQSIQIQEQIYTEEHVLKYLTYLKLGILSDLLYPERYNYNETLLLKGFDIVRTNWGIENFHYSNALEVLSDFYTTHENFAKAENFLNQTLQYWLSQKIPNNIHVASIYNKKGLLDYAQESYSSAINFFEKSLKLYQKIYGDDHYLVANCYAWIGKSRFMNKELDASVSNMEQCIPLYLAYIDRHFGSLSFQEKAKYWFGMKDHFEFYYFLMLDQNVNANQKRIGEVYNTVIQTKGLLLSTDIKLRQQISSSGDTLLVQLFENWISLKERLTYYNSIDKEELASQNIDINNLKNNIEKVEKEIASRSLLFEKSNQNKIDLTWKNIRLKLDKNDVAIETVRYRSFDKKFTDTVRYAFLCVSPETKSGPKLTHLKEGNLIESKYYKYYKNMLLLKNKDNYSFDKYFKELKISLDEENAKRIFFSSDGVYNQLNLESIVDHNGAYIYDQYQIVYLSNTKDLLLIPDANKKKTKQNDSIYLCGNPEFYTNGYLSKERTVSDLPGTAKEIDQIREILEVAKVPYSVFLSTNATEQQVKKVVNPKVLHLSTHGFFMKPSEAESIQNPMLYSGLILAGGGEIIDDLSFEHINQKDGILTAYEAVSMHLEQTQTVVLSACETGLGEVVSGEGVYGLQRAFLVAGAKNIIVSMFKVDDEITNMLMTNFYKYWVSGKTQREAFRLAKLKIKEKYPEPVNWASFIMIEGYPAQQNIK